MIIFKLAVVDEIEGTTFFKLFKRKESAKALKQKALEYEKTKPPEPVMSNELISLTESAHVFSDLTDSSLWSEWEEENDAYVEKWCEWRTNHPFHELDENSEYQIIEIEVHD